MNLFGNRIRTLLGAGVVAMAAAAPAHAALIAQESFDYEPGVYVTTGQTFVGLNGGTGWEPAGWFGHFNDAGMNMEITAGGTGNHLNGSNMNFAANGFIRSRWFTSNAPVDNSGIWQSMQFGSDGSGTGAAGPFSAGGFGVLTNSGFSNYAVGIDQNGFFTLTTNHGSITQTSSTTVGSNQVVLVHTRLNGPNLTTDMWVNPNFGGGEAGLGAPLLSSTYAPPAGAVIGQVVVNPGNSLRLDEILFGTALADVAQSLPPPPPKGDKVGWQFVMRGAAALAPAETAGFTGFEQANWNADGPNGQASSGSELNLVDSNGQATGINVNWTGSGNSWNLNGPLGSPDAKLLDGFLNQQPAVVVSDIPVDFAPAGYSVIVYYNNNEGNPNDPATSDITITGILDDSIVQRMFTGPTALTRFDENGFLLEDGSLSGATNVMIFEGLDDLGFTLSFTTVSGNGNNGITGFQIVANAVIVPEPTTAMLIGLAAAGLAFSRRNRRENEIA